MYSFCLFFCLLLSGWQGAFGQEIMASGGKLDKLVDGRTQQDTNYVHRYKKRFSPRLITGSKTTTFGFGDPGQIDSKRYYPNVASSIGLGVFYKTIGISFSYLMQAKKRERNASMGKSSFFDLELRTYQVRFCYNAYYQTYSGFFIAKPTGFGLPSRVRDLPEYKQREDIKVHNSGISIFGISNWRKFSMQAAFQNTKRQQKSAGSFLYGAHLQYLHISGDSAINSNKAQNISENKPADTVGFVRGRFVSFTPRVGYGHTFVLRKFYITGVYFVGPGLQYQNLKDAKGHLDNFASPYLSTNLMLAAGYNSQRFFASIQLINDESRNYIKGARLQASTQSTMFQVGYRF